MELCATYIIILMFDVTSFPPFTNCPTYPKILWDGNILLSLCSIRMEEIVDVKQMYLITAWDKHHHECKQKEKRIHGDEDHLDMMYSW